MLFKFLLKKGIFSCKWIMLEIHNCKRNSWLLSKSWHVCSSGRLMKYSISKGFEFLVDSYCFQITNMHKQFIPSPCPLPYLSLAVRNIWVHVQWVDYLWLISKRFSYQYLYYLFLLALSSIEIHEMQYLRDQRIVIS